MERNVNILDWQNSIEYQMYNDVEYQDLDDVTKIVCIVYDFFDLTKGKWSTSDLLLLKKAMALIGINPKNKISYENFIQKLSANSELCRHLLGEDFSFATEYEAIAFSLNKMNRLATEEKYLVQATKKSLAKNGINISNEEIIYQITEDFVAQEADFHLSTEVSNYELILELLYNLARVRYANELAKALQKPKTKLELAREFFIEGRIPEALPIIIELAEVGDVQAGYMLGILYYHELFVSFIDNEDYVKEMLNQNISEGDICSLFCKCRINYDYENETLKKHLSELTVLANGGNVFAQYELGEYYSWHHNFCLKVKYYKMAADKGYCFAQDRLANFYYNADSYYNEEDLDKYYRKAIELYEKLYAKGEYSECMIAICYKKLGKHDQQLKWLLRGFLREERFYSLQLAYFYQKDGGDKYKNYAKAIEYYKRAIELGESRGYEEYFIGKMYLDGGYGITASRSTAREWLKKAADKGNSDAQKWLREN